MDAETLETYWQRRVEATGAYNAHGRVFGPEADRLWKEYKEAVALWEVAQQAYDAAQSAGAEGESDGHRNS